MLKAPSFDCVYKWRCEQEDKLRAKNPDASGIMNKAQIHAFIQHYQRLTERCLATLPNSFDLVFELNHERKIMQAIYK
jgi:D-glycerate 3-kinase